MGVDELVVLPVVEPPSPQRIVYAHGASLGSGSLNETDSLSVSPGCAVRSAPAFTDGGGGAWQVPEPASVNVLPATGTNFQAYPAESRVSCSTPNVPELRTWLFDRVVPKEVVVAPPVPALNSRISYAGPPAAAGVCGASRWTKP